MKKIIFILVSLFLTNTAWALNDGFNFTECSGSGNFEQQIQHYSGDYENAITVGSIPEGIEGLNIELTSDKDVDIRLYGQNNDKIVHWPYGLLPQATERIAFYQGTDITYSGYNGINGEYGHEFITVSGTTQVPMTMKAFGYKAGFATVNYSWTGKEGCNNSGDGNFTQSIAHDALTLIGEIPVGVPNVRVALTSANDLDIQLYGEDGTVIVGWKPIGLLSGSRVGTVEYNGMSIEWSGYNGTNDHKGHEYIQITGNTTEILTMKVYGYEAGFADVTYSWRDDNITNVCTDEYAPVCGTIALACVASPCEPIEHTFSNICEFNNIGIEFLHDGECNSTIEPTPTPEPCLGVYAPVCGEYLSGGDKQTFENMCELENTIDVAYIHDGECNSTIEPTPTPTPQPCIDIYEPVCGQLPDCLFDINGSELCHDLPIDGYTFPITFSNMCELENAEAIWISTGECDTNDTNDSNVLQDELSSNLSLWQSQNITDYTFDSHISNYWFDKHQTNSVSNNVLTVIESHVIPSSFEISEEDKKTINDYFELLQDAIIAQYSTINVTYHPIFGYPLSIYFDMDTMIADEEMYYNLNNLIPHNIDTTTPQP